MSDLDARREEKRTHLVVEKPAVDMIRLREGRRTDPETAQLGR